MKCCTLVLSMKNNNKFENINVNTSFEQWCKHNLKVKFITNTITAGKIKKHMMITKYLLCVVFCRNHS